jgi:AraC family transcriptional regulator of adaptative response/methylated-DNA-[protein]-cysteine methyltransferase
MAVRKNRVAGRARGTDNGAIGCEKEAVMNWWAGTGSEKTYETIAEAIRFVRRRARAQPSLAEVAQHVGLSPHHLQRLFAAWAGVSPKRFLQYLTKEHAKALLRESRDVLGAALEAGLSGPGRLHDLMVACEAVTPGELHAGGPGLEIAYGFADTPFGHVLVGTTARGVCHLHFVEDGGEALALERLHAEWPRAALVSRGEAAGAVATRMFAGARAGQGPLHLWLRGTNFQIKVWEALLRVPAGAAVSYRDLARLAGTPGAARAAGSALARNPIAVLIPCHRVIREDGSLGQYRWGAERKQALLAWECAAREADRPSAL